MNLQRLRAFQAVMVNGSVTQAATALHLTQPAVSKLLLALEQEVGFRLFERMRGRLAATAEGRAFFRRAERVLAGIAELSSIARDIAGFRAGHLRLVCMPALATTLMPCAIARFREGHPDILVSLEVIPQRDAGSWISGHEFDLGITALPLDWANVAAEPFVTGRPVAVVPRSYRQARQRVVVPPDLSGQPFIRLTPANLLRAQLDAVLAAARVEPSVVVETSSPTAACRLAGEGMGMAVVDLFSSLATPHPEAVVLPLRSSIELTYGFFRPSGPRSGLAARFEPILAELVRRAIARRRVG
jgi:DNA-binding transcriptional LysR family regulator